MGDVDNDGQPEVVIGSDDGNIYAWDSDGALAAGWPKNTSYPIKSAPVLLNLDLDAEPEVIAANYEGSLKILGGPSLLYFPLIQRK